MITPEQFKAAKRIVDKYEKQKEADTATRADYVGKMAFCWLNDNEDRFCFCRLMEKQRKGMVKVQIYRGEGRFNGKNYTAKIRGLFDIPFKDIMFNKHVLKDL